VRRSARSAAPGAVADAVPDLLDLAAAAPPDRRVDSLAPARTVAAVADERPAAVAAGLDRPLDRLDAVSARSDRGTARTAPAAPTGDRPAAGTERESLSGDAVDTPVPADPTAVRAALVRAIARVTVAVPGSIDVERVAPPLVDRLARGTDPPEAVARGVARLAARPAGRERVVAAARSHDGWGRLNVARRLAALDRARSVPRGSDDGRDRDDDGNGDGADPPAAGRADPPLAPDDAIRGILDGSEPYGSGVLERGR